MSWAARAALLAVFLLAGCNGNAGTLPAVPFVQPQAGDPQDFHVHLWNGSQFPLVVAMQAVGGTNFAFSQQPYVVAIGTEADFAIPFLPATVQLAAETDATPAYVYPVRTLELGRDFSATVGHADTSYP